MNNKKIIFGAGWVIGLLAVGVGGYAYFVGDMGSGGSVAWSNGVALVESSWDEAVGMPAATQTGASGVGDSDGSGSSGSGGSDDSNDQIADNQSAQPVPTTQAAPSVPPGPPPVYSMPDETSTAVAVTTATTTTTAATTTASPTQAVPVVATPIIASPTESAPTVSYAVPSSSLAIASTTPVATTTETVAVAPTPEPTSTEAASTGTTSTDTEASTTVPVSTTPTSTPPIAAASIDHPVIVEVQIAGAASSNDFVKIFNPTGAAIDLTGWKLHKKSSTGTDYSLKTFPTGMMIVSGGYITWANSENGFADSIGVDVSSTETLSADNSVALMDPSGAVIDAVAWGTGMNQYVEGDAYPTDPTAGQVLVRKSDNGSVVDTDDNANDFTLQ